MPISPTTIVNQGECWFCDPDPQDVDTVGSEQAGDRIWVVVSVPQPSRTRCVIALPLSRHMEKAGSYNIKIPSKEITVEGSDPNIDRVALADQIRVLDKTRFRRRFGHVSPRAISSIFLGFDYLCGRSTP